MFSYYGSKGKIVDCYPPPKHNKIIEPFAGAAKYSLKYFDNDVLIVDKYKTIVDVWKYLQSASESEILKLPILKHGDSLDNYEQLSHVEKSFMGFLVCGGVSSPRIRVGSFNGVNVERDLKRIAKSLYKIRHWTIANDSYENIPNQIATWYVDPPYQYGGEHYIESNKKINYDKLREWCIERKGQTIVCENSRATWMNFLPVVGMHGSQKKTTECIWSNMPTAFDNVQTKLFDDEQ